MDDATVETLATAFYDDPLMRWLFADDARRHAQLRTWWAWIIDNRQSHVEVLATPDELIPRTVRDAVIARASRLSAAARSVLEIASVIGFRSEPCEV